MIPCLPTEPDTVLSIARAAAASSPVVVPPATAGEGTGGAQGRWVGEVSDRYKPLHPSDGLDWAWP